MLSTLVEQTRRHALEIAGTQRLASPTTGVRRRHRPTLLSFGELCDDCVAVIAAEHVAVEPQHDVRDLHAQLRARLDVRGVIVVEPEAATDSRAAEVVLNLHRIHRDLPLAYVAHQPDPTTRRSILRVGARYIDHTQPTYAKTMREMAPLLAVGAARTASITEAATPRYGFDDTEQRLLHDFDPERGTMLIRLGKGNKDRMVPVGERAIRWVETYLGDARPKLVTPPDEGVLFLGVLGDALAPNRLTELVRDHVNASGVGKKGSCHLFRHTMATLMLEGGADIRFIQEMLGHANVSTTQIYTQVSIHKLKEIHAATHPGATLEKREREDGDAGDEDREGAMDEAELLAALEDEAHEEEGDPTS